MDSNVIEQQTGLPLTTRGNDIGKVPTMFVSGANLPVVYEPQAIQYGGLNAPQLQSPETASIEQRAYAAAQALRAWTRYNQERYAAGALPDLNVVKALLEKVVTEGDAEDGIAAWLALDGDRLSRRTVQEYRGTARDLFLYLAQRGISPAETSAEDMKAWKAFLQSDGAPAQMELLRAQWYGREARIFYRIDWRGVVGLVAVFKMDAARADRVKAEAALAKAAKRQAGTLNRLINQARAAEETWQVAIANMIATFATMTLQPKCEKYTSDTVSLRVTLARNIFKMAMSRQAASDVNPLLEIKVAKNGTGRSQKIISRYFSDDEVLTILADRDENKAHSPRAKALAARDTAMIRLARNQGMRISEISKLAMDDFNPTAGEFGTLQIRHAKGDKFRTAFLSEKTRYSLDRYLQYRELLNPHTDALFVTMNNGAREGCAQPGGMISERAIRDMFDETQKRLGIKVQGRSVHGLRHSYATRVMMEDEGALVSLSLSMGHSGPAVTMGYVEAAQLIKKNPAKLAEI